LRPFAGGEVLAGRGLVLAGRLAALLDQLLDDGKGLGVVERGPLVDLALLDGGEQQADRRQARGIAAAHRRLHVLGDPCLQVHVRLLGCPAPPRGEHGAAPSPLIAGADAKSPLRAGLDVSGSRWSRPWYRERSRRAACRRRGGPEDRRVSVELLGQHLAAQALEVALDRRRLLELALG